MVNEKSERITVQVQPNAHRNKVVSFNDSVLHIKIAAPPIKGKANRELLEYLGRMLGIAKSNLAIEKGLASRRKLIKISGLTQDQIVAKIESQLDS